MLLPLQCIDKKKRKVSSIEDEPMWSEPRSVLSSSGPGSGNGSGGGGGGSVGISMGSLSLPPSASALSTMRLSSRALLALVAVVVFMVVTLSNSSFMKSGSTNSIGAMATNFRHGTVDNGAAAAAVPAPMAPAQQPDRGFYDDYDARSNTRLRRETPAPLLRPDSFGLVIVADLDKKSRDDGTNSNKPTFHSFLLHATLKIGRDGSSQKDVYSVTFGEEQKFSTAMNEAGRGFELSELAWFNGKLLSFDDRTGIVYRLKNFEGAKPIQAIPAHIVMEGDGLNGKGQKHEWATVKDGELYMGSVGKEFTDNDGNVLTDSNLWVAVMDAAGDVRHEDWTANFARVRTALGCDYPGYVVHEAIEWSSVHRQWFILPRRVSTEAYNDMEDETRGSNKLVIASEDFSSIEVREVGNVTPLRGFSSFKFLPRSDDSVIVAIKSVEIDAEQSQTSFIMVFDLKGNVLLDETELPGGKKFEGVAFARDWDNDKIRLH